MNTNSFEGFDDLGDDFDSEPVAVNRAANVEEASKMTSVKPKGTMIEEKCPKCAGSGRYRAPSSLGHDQCLKCKGKGILYFKNSAKDRAASRQKAAERKQSKAEKAFAEFEVANPEVASWWNGEGASFDFAISLKETVMKWGNLTPNQLAAAHRCIEKCKAGKIAAAERSEHAEKRGQVDVNVIVKALEKAAKAGLKNPKIRLLAGEAKIVVYRAAAHSVNAGSLYVKSTDEGQYFGKITAGKFFRAREVSDELETNIVEACSTLPVSAVAYGRATGQCSCCGRELTCPVSIERGIGPICEGKFF